MSGVRLLPYYTFVDANKESVEIYSLEDSKYDFQEFSPENPFTFCLSGDSPVDVVVKNFWE